MKFSCPHCGQRISAGLEQTGIAADCPNCAGTFVVPGNEAGDDDPPVAAAKPSNDDPPGDLEADDSLTDDNEAIVGNYQLVSKLGEGGFGNVYLAEQSEPVKRQVALKILKPGRDSREVVARFEAERQALAMMDHPNIAHVYDAGSTATGRPYFVMELVVGEPITKFCDDLKLTIEQRLELFILVCNGVQHAHTKGVVHRDLKPSNVIVSLHDNQPVPKVIDFGIAKAISQELTSDTIFTMEGQMVGTPQYMSPEQAAGSIDVDTRTDVYALGILLYELLVGKPPLDPERLLKIGWIEMARIIIEDEPERPSTKLSGSGDDTASCGEHRGIDPGKLRRQIQGDLDWIVMTALDKDRDRRYQSAKDLANEVQRYLDNKPVLATPPSASYRIRKFVRRNKLAVGAAALVLASILLGTVVSVWQAKEAIRERKLAKVAQEAAERTQLEIEKTRKEVEKFRDEVAIKSMQVLEQEKEVERQKAEATRQEMEAERQRALAAIKVKEAEHQRSLVAGKQREADRQREAAYRRGYSSIMVQAHDAVAKADYEQLKKLLDTIPDEISNLRGWEYDFLSNMQAEPQVSIPLEYDLHSTLAWGYTFQWSPDGRTILTSGRNPTGRTFRFQSMHIWNAQSGVLLQDFGIDGQDAAWSPNGQQIAAITKVARFSILSPAGTILREAEVDVKGLISLAWSPNGAFLALVGWKETGKPTESNPPQDTTVSIFDAGTMKEVVSTSFESGSVRDLAWSPDGKVLAISRARDPNLNEGLVLLDAKTLNRIHTVHNGQYNGNCAWTIDGVSIVESSVNASGRSIYVFDIQEKQKYQIYPGGDFALHPDGRQMVSSHHGLVALRSAPWFESRYVSFQPYGGSPIAWDPAGRRFATAIYRPDRKAFDLGIWDAASLRPLHQLRPHRITPEGRAGRNEFRTLAHTGPLLESLSWSPDSQQLALCDQDGWISILDPQTNQTTSAWDSGEAPATWVEWSRDGDLLATIGPSNQLKVWTPGGELKNAFTPGAAIQRTAWTHSGDLLCLDDSGELSLWSHASVESPRTKIQLPHAAAIFFDLAADGTTGAVAHEDGAIQLINFLPSLSLGQLIPGKDPISQLAIRADGTRIATTDASGTIAIWTRAESEWDLSEFSDQKGPILSLHWHPTENRLVTSREEFIQLWDPSAEAEVLRLPLRRDSAPSTYWKDFQQVRWSPDGRRLACFGGNPRIGTLHSSTLHIFTAYKE